MVSPENQNELFNWTAKYYQQEQLLRKTQDWRHLLRPSVFGAILAIAGRTIVGPSILLLLFIFTKYLQPEATFLATTDNSSFAFTEHDVAMAGGCLNCVGTCKVVLLKYSLLNGKALISGPAFATFAGQPPAESLYDFSSLSTEVLALGESLDSEGAMCQSGLIEWGVKSIAVTGTAQQVLEVITTMNLNISPQAKREVELGVDLAAECATKWTIMAIPRQFSFSTVHGSAEFGKISAVAINVFPQYTECRPNVPVDVGHIGSKLGFVTSEDLLAVVPEAFKLFPYTFKSSMKPVSRVVAAAETKYQESTVLQPMLHAYYGGCRVREVNATGVYIEGTCEVSKHWQMYGLMVQTPDDIPLCSTGGVCIHSFYNSQWEGITTIEPEKPNEVMMYVNTFQSHHADKVGISILPGIVVMQIFTMGIVSLYVFVAKRSVLISQIWAYRCQNGQMQVLYLVQIAYHLCYNSDLYLIGFSTGTLTTESLANLTCCFYAFSYSFINLAKARSGNQQLDRHFRLAWEATQVIITACVVATLRVVKRHPLEIIISRSAQILRKTSPLGAKYCGIHEACIIFTVNTFTIVTILSALFGAIVVTTSVLAKKLSPKVQIADLSAKLSLVHVGSFNGIQPIPTIAVATSWTLTFLNRKRHRTLPAELVLPFGRLTSFEQNCLGSPFKKLFHDCGDFTYVMYNDKRCSTVEALLLTGHIYYGDHIYQATSVILLVAARLLPRKVLRTFNVLILRWRLDATNGTVTHALSCTWYEACKENHSFNGATPVA